LVPMGNVVVVNVATSFETVPVPIMVEPLKNSTVPVGAEVAVLAGMIVAVNVTEALKTGGVPCVKVRLVVVEIWVTGTVTAADVLEVNVLSPEYCAVIALEPGNKVVVENVATPLAIVPVPNRVVPRKKSTEPVGVAVPLTAATVAVRVTLCPKTGAVGEKVSVVVDVAVAATVTVTGGDVLAI
jgi:hypothetical protein